MIKKGFLIMLCLGIIMSCFAGCGGENKPAAPAATTAAPSEVETIPADGGEETVVTTEEPDDGSIRFYYDDRISFEELGATESSVITVKEQTITSKIVGTEDLDSQLLYFDEANKQYIAVGVGTAVLDIDGTEVVVKVRPAPISLFMITGHSLGAGQCGNGAQSVKIEAGQAYSSHKTATFQEATDDMGIGFAAPSKPEGIDAFAPGGGGTIGEGSAMAWKWNQLTGEKVWVLNAAVGGSVIPEWHQNQKFYVPAVAMYRAAAKVLSNEVQAGHYVLKNTCVIYHSGANFEYKNVEFTDEVMEYWYDSMIEGFKNDLAYDYDGDGKKEELDAIGIVPSGAGKFNNDKPINYYIAATDLYPNVYILSKSVYQWRSDDLLRENFPPIEYETQSEPVELPTYKSEIYAEDGVHLTQCGYNAAGLMIGENLHTYFRTKLELESIQLLDENGSEIKSDINLKRKGSSKKLILLTEPCYISDLKIELSDNLEMISPFTIKATAEGAGYVKIFYGKELIKEIVVNVGD